MSKNEKSKQKLQKSRDWNIEKSANRHWKFDLIEKSKHVKAEKSKKSKNQTKDWKVQKSKIVEIENFNLPKSRKRGTK